MKTVTIQIGNSDDKLSQKQWSAFCGMVGEVVSKFVTHYSSTVHFHSCSPGDASWQNAAWVIVIPNGAIHFFREELANVRTEFYQDSIAFTEGETSFI